MGKQKIYRAISIILIIAFVGGCINPTKLCAAEDSPMTVAYENKAELETAINELIDQYKDVTPSVSITVFDDKQDICSVVYGDSDMEHGIAADENTVYEWGSISKVLIWTSAMQLYEQGRLDLNEDIRTYLPNGFLKNLSYDKPITLLNLMNHNAGFQSPYKDEETAEFDALMPLDEALTEIAPAQIYAPGDVVAYSNWGAALTGYMVECVSGMDYADYVDKNIFQRLGMKYTAILPDMSDNEWTAEQRKKTHCYIQGDGGLESMGECRRYIHIYPAGSACGTISDLAIFAKAFLCDSRDCPLFEKDDTLDLMLSASLFYSDGTTPRFCHGLETDHYGVILLGHGGNTTGFTSLMQIDLNSRTGFVMMVNKQLDRIYRDKLPKLLYGDLVVDELSSENFEKLDFSGHYIMSGGTFEAGCFSIYSFFFDRFHVKEKDGLYTGSNGVTSLTQISDDVVIFRLLTGKEYPYYIRTDERGAFSGFENSSLDFIKISSFRYYSGWVILVLMLTGIVVMFAMLIAHIISFRKYKTQDTYKFKVRELLTGLVAFAIAADIFMLFHFGIHGEIARTVFCAIIAALSAFLAALNIVCWLSRPDQAKKAVLMIESMSSIFIIVGVIYWRLYQFWGF